MILFFIGLLEMVIVTAWTKVVIGTKVMASGAITLVNILIWYYVLETIVSDINNWRLVLLYAFGCALGTMLTTFYFANIEKKQSKELTSQSN